jgi:asparagine synthase (glutamine-hydrolysing)
MFAFAVWDREVRTLTLVRDRLGVKPLLFGWSADTFLFGSELKAFRMHPNWRYEISRQALGLFARYGYVPAPWSIVSGVWKLLPGCMATIPFKVLERGEQISPWPEEGPEKAPGKGIVDRYWSMADVVQQGIDAPFKGDATALLDDLDQELTQSVALRMVADVPLGAFLSGGTDSSLVVSLMHKVASGPIKTFSIGFGEERYNEAPFARRVAEHLGTDHTELHVSGEMAQGVVGLLPLMCDEPFGDSSIIPTYLVSKLARESVTVSLSGDGGDELFGGYDRYTLLDTVARIARCVPRPARKAASMMAAVLPFGQAERLQVALRKSGFFPFDLHNPAEKVRKVLSVFGESGPHALYGAAVKHWPDEVGVVLGVRETRLAAVPELGDFRAYMALWDTSRYLPDDILTKVDRASMACSLEAREPLLDHRLVEFAWRVPTAVKYRDGRGKWPLRALLLRYLPRELVDRPKKGFAIPLDGWLRGSLREWARELLNERRLREQGLFDPVQVGRFWTDHDAGRRNVSQLLWNILMFQAWYDGCIISSKVR